jgi:hypothetical protein
MVLGYIVQEQIIYKLVRTPSDKKHEPYIVIKKNATTTIFFLGL